MKRLGNPKNDHDGGRADHSGTETEAREGPDKTERSDRIQTGDPGLKPAETGVKSRKRRNINIGSASGDLSTDSEWDKVENEGYEERSQ